VRELFVYILASKSGVLYVGVTNDLQRRLREHRASKVGFTAAYRVHRLVYFEKLGPPLAAIAREKQLKRWTRRRKLALIKSVNPYLVDLARGWSRRRTDVPAGRHPERSEGSRSPARPRGSSGG
jgi:putative endonuclease